MNNYIELTVYTTHIGSDLVCDCLWNYTDLGIAVSDVEDILDLAKLKKNTWDYIDDDLLKRDKTVLVKCYIPLTEKAKILEIENSLNILKQNSPLPLGSLETVKREIDGDEWREKWKEHFKPIHIGNVVIVPEWIDYKTQDGELEVKLDSNMAFGTGEHETTSLCIEFLQKYVKSEDTVLDVGCGSGILGITAKKLGAFNVIMTDIDECAVSASEHNMVLNGISSDSVKVILKNLLDDNTIKGDVVVCNIMAEVLVMFASGIKNNIKDNGVIILSGILTTKLDFVKDAYIKSGFTFIEEKIKGEWSAVVFSYGEKK